MLLRRFKTRLSIFSPFAAVLSVFVGHAVDAAVIAGVIILNSLLGFFQEWRAKCAQHFAGCHPPMPGCSGRVSRKIDASDVVPDILIIETGNRVAATAPENARTEGWKVDESALTGESVPAGKSRVPINGTYRSLTRRISSICRPASPRGVAVR